MELGYEIYGSGKEKVIIMHDWFCDQTSYDFMKHFIDYKFFTYCFVDIRGYGKSIGIKGEYTLNEIVSDILQLKDKLKWEKFHLIGHSMTGMVVQKMLVEYPDLIKGAIAITPVPACGSKVDDQTLEFMEHAAKDNDEFAKQAANMMSGNRLSDIFLDYKVKRWRETSTPEARIAYCHMFTQTDFSAMVKNCLKPLLVIAGEYDAESLNEKIQRETILKWFKNAEIIACKNSAHYPMIETPVFLVTCIENYLKKFSC